MIRKLLIAAAALCLLGAKAPPSVDYRLGISAQGDAPPLAEVEIRFQGDADGETVLQLPDSFGHGKDLWRYISDIQVRGADVTAPDAAHRVLRHRPNARLTVRYRVQTAYPEGDPPGAEQNPYRGPILRPTWFALLGDMAFATPEGRDRQAARFRWGRLPKGWRAVSDLEHGALGRPMTVADVAESISVGGPAMEIVEIPSVPRLRIVRPPGTDHFPAALADEITKAVAAQRAFWNDPNQPYLVAMIPLTPKPGGGRSAGGTGRGDGFTLYATPGGRADELGWIIAHEHIHTWIPALVGHMPPGDREPEAYWLSEGFTDFFAIRAMVRGGLMSLDDAVIRLDEILTAYDRSPARTAPVARIVADFWKDGEVQMLPYRRGLLLALKWDEEIRRKTGGKADLDDVILRMRDHYRQFAPGQGPDVVTGLVSAAWVVAQIDLRPDIARYATGGAVVPLPETLFDKCLDAMVTVSPGFDSGFDHEASFAGKVVKGVRRRGPAWNSGLRDGMRLESWSFTPGDMTREVELTVRQARRNARPRTIRYWPYGDNDVESRKIQITPDLTREQLAACGRKLGGL